MEKLVLISYQKYQRMQSNLTGHGENSIIKSSAKTSEKRPNETSTLEPKNPEPKTTNKRHSKSTRLVVPLPPPGIRDNQKSKTVKPKKEEKLEWISF